MIVSNLTREYIYAYFDLHFHPDDVAKYWVHERAKDKRLTPDNLLVFVDGTMSMH